MFTDGKMIAEWDRVWLWRRVLSRGPIKLPGVPMLMCLGFLHTCSRTQVSFLCFLSCRSYFSRGSVQFPIRNSSSFNHHRHASKLKDKSPRPKVESVYVWGEKSSREKIETEWGGLKMWSMPWITFQKRTWEQQTRGSRLKHKQCLL